MADAANEARVNRNSTLWFQRVDNDNHIEMLTIEIEALEYIAFHPRTTPIERNNAAARMRNLAVHRDILEEENERIDREIEHNELWELDPNVEIVPEQVVPSLEGQENE